MMCCPGIPDTTALTAPPPGSQPKLHLEKSFDLSTKKNIQRSLLLTQSQSEQSQMCLVRLTAKQRSLPPAARHCTDHTTLSGTPVAPRRRPQVLVGERRCRVQGDSLGTSKPRPSLGVVWCSEVRQPKLGFSLGCVSQPCQLR